MLQEPNDVASMQRVDLSFDDAAFYQALEQRRTAQNMSWRQLGRELGLSPSTFSRLARGRRPDVETFVKLLAWLDLPADSFMHGGAPALPGAQQDTLAVIAAALRSDHTIPAAAAGAIEQLLRVAYGQVSSGGQGSSAPGSGTIDSE
jgi:transcriptional regulator with XRE-family HTH domain